MPSHTAFYTSGCFTITSLIAREKLAMNMYLVDMSSRVNELLIPHFAHARYSTSQRYPTHHQKFLSERFPDSGVIL